MDEIEVVVVDEDDAVVDAELVPVADERTDVIPPGTATATEDVATGSETPAWLVVELVELAGADGEEVVPAAED